MTRLHRSHTLYAIDTHGQSSVRINREWSQSENLAPECNAISSNSLPSPLPSFFIKCVSVFLPIFLQDQLTMARSRE